MTRTQKRVRVGAAVLFSVGLGVVFALPAAATPSPRPTLTLSAKSGSAGTRVTVVGHGCEKPFAQADTLAWHDHYYWKHDLEKRPPLGVWRSIPLRRLSPTTIRAVFSVRRTDHPGRGLLDLFCRGTANAVATFTVTR